MIIAAKPILNSAIRQVTHTRSPVFARTSQPVATFNANPPANWNPFVWLFDKIQKVFEIFAKTSLGQLLGKGLKKINHLLQAPKKEPVKPVSPPVTPSSPPPTRPVSPPEPTPSTPVKNDVPGASDKAPSQPNPEARKPQSAKSNAQPDASKIPDKPALTLEDKHKAVVFDSPRFASLNQQQLKKTLKKKQKAAKAFRDQMGAYKIELAELQQTHQSLNQKMRTYVKERIKAQQKLLRKINNEPVSDEILELEPKLELPDKNIIKLKSSRFNRSANRPLYQQLQREIELEEEITKAWCRNLEALSKEAALRKQAVSTCETYLEKLKKDTQRILLEQEKFAVLEDLAATKAGATP